MPKYKNPSATTPKSSSRGTPLVVLATMAGGMFLSYIVGYLTFLYQHPIHWGMAIGGGIVGWLIGKLIYRLRGETDII